MGRQEKVKFYMTLYLLPCFVISLPEGSHLDGDGGSVGMTWISTWTHPRVQGLSHGHGEGLAAGRGLWVLSLLGWFYHYWGFPFIFEVPNINCQGPQSCLQGWGSARGAKGTPTHMETAENEQDTENIPKSHPKHLRDSKPRQNHPISNSVCKGEIRSCVEEAAQGESQPWQISIIPLRSILLGQQVGINHIFMDLKELRGFGLSSSSSAQPSPKASNEKQKEKGTKAKETKRNLHISSV